MSWIEEEETKIPLYSRQELEGLYKGMMRVNLFYEKKFDELFDIIKAKNGDIRGLSQQLRRIGITPYTEKEQCKIIQMTNNK